MTELVIRISLDDPRLMCVDPVTQEEAGDGNALGRILRNLADSWADQVFGGGQS